jgi:hypothetical protein
MTNNLGQCRERKRLMRAYCEAITAHARIAETYAETMEKAGFEDVARKEELASLACDGIRFAIQMHSLSHGCDRAVLSPGIPKTRGYLELR